MKELSIEEKAKRYDEALEKARIWKDKSGMPKDRQGILDDIFPELKESEDEKVRNTIFDCLYKCCDSGVITRKQREKCIAYLEKQGEQKPADVEEVNFFDDFRKTDSEVEPKFHEGDWVVSPNGVYWHIDAINNNRYEVSSYTGKCADWPLDTDLYHLWTIQEDAKDGDMLCTYECDEPKIVFILRGTPKKHYALSYHCYYNIMYPHFASDSEKGCLAPNDEDVKPATKEQRDLLFQKIKEAGYEWNAEHKQLKKIEHESVWSEEDEDIICFLINITEGYRIRNGFSSELEKGNKAIDWLKSLKNRVQLKQEWSEEDEKRISSILLSIEYCKEQYPNLREYQYDIDWLKFLKERVYPQSEWGEEDGDIRDNIIRDLKRLSGDMVSPNQTYQKEIQWLKSLRPQSQWKPSDEQMNAFDAVLVYNPPCSNECRNHLITLYNELKKLRNE